MRNPFKLFVEMFKQPLWVIAWVNTLVLVNMFGIYYFDHVLSKWIVGIFLLQTIFMMILYSYYGYEKILGLAHILWIPLAGYIILDISNYSGQFVYYLIVLLFLNMVSVLFDTYDVIAYFKNKNT
ncbi:MAG: hypothetical protein DHS20C09_04080 [marine bacterium B5-7]|nr:MAG: hypothetical protein DHS20C09_04080 [marine bacterium B5-7]